MKQHLSRLTDTAREAVQEVKNKADKLKGELIELPMFKGIAATGESHRYDEKHYFVIPFYLSPCEFALHQLRALPPGVGEHNTLPKRRVFHFAHPDMELALRHYMQQTAAEMVSEHREGTPHVLERLADDIDALDKKLTYGMLAVGGVAALVNPLLGAGIAAKALLPGAGSLLNKYGLRPVGEKLRERQIEKETRDAQAKLDTDFESAQTIKVINPLLQTLSLSLNSTESEYDPLIGINFAAASLPELDGEDWRQLTELAICDTYDKVINTPSLHQKARLEEKDLRWLSLMQDKRRREKE